MPTWSEIQLWKAATLSSYVDTVSSKKQTIDQQIATLQARRTSFQGEGQTADALRNAMSTAHKELSNLAEELRHVHIAITQATGRVQQVESLVANTLSSASARHCTISDSGTVTCTFGHDFSVRHKLESEVQSMVRNAIRAAEQVDNDFRALLTNVGTARTAPAYRARGTHALSKAEEAAFAKMTPQQRADYWSQQSDEQKKFLCDNYPDLIGNADGVEAWARDRANRRRLPKLKQAAETEKAKLERDIANAGDNTALKADLEERLTKVKARLDAYKKIEETVIGWGPIDPNVKDGTQVGFSSTYGKQRPGYLSLLTLQEENGRVLAAVAQGDVDHAKNVATVVPGIGTTVEGGLQNEIKRGANLRSAAVAEGNIDSKDVAVVSWLGYEAPPGPSKDLGEDLKIATIDLADKGSDKLAGFLTGVNASRMYGAGDANMTLLGHSYGSVVSGRATTKIADGVVDNEILFGSPGMGTYDPSEIHVPQGRRFVSGVPEGDFVQGVSGKRYLIYGLANGLATFFAPAGQIVSSGMGVAELYGEASGFGQLGMDPLSHNSTFVHISDDATGSKEYNPEGFPSWTIVPDTSNHSVYMDPGTETLRDMGRIVAGGNLKP